MPKISIVMPTYNQGKFIKQAVDSFMAQTFRDFELIIVNDGSTDNSASIVCESFKDYIAPVSAHPVIYWVHKTNGGTGSALNVGFAAARGKYETWFASDNVLYPEALQAMSDYLDAHPDIDFVYCNCEIGVMDQKDGTVELYRKNLEREVSQEWKPENLIHHYFLGIVWLWRKELRLKAGEFQIEPCEDYFMVLKMYHEGGRFAYIPQCLGWFRRHYENMSWKIAASGDRDRFSKLVQAKARALHEEKEKARVAEYQKKERLA